MLPTKTSQDTIPNSCLKQKGSLPRRYTSHPVAHRSRSASCPICQGGENLPHVVLYVSVWPAKIGSDAVDTSASIREVPERTDIYKNSSSSAVGSFTCLLQGELSYVVTIMSSRRWLKTSRALTVSPAGLSLAIWEYVIFSMHCLKHFSWALQMLD